MSRLQYWLMHEPAMNAHIWGNFFLYFHYFNFIWATVHGRTKNDPEVLSNLCSLHDLNQLVICCHIHPPPLLLVSPWGQLPSIIKFFSVIYSPMSWSITLVKCITHNKFSTSMKKVSRSCSSTPDLRIWRWRNKL